MWSFGFRETERDIERQGERVKQSETERVRESQRVQRI